MKTWTTTTVTLTAAILALASTAPSLESPQGGKPSAGPDLLFSTMCPELTRAATFPTSLQGIRPEDVAIVHPEPSSPYTAEKCATQPGWMTLAGDYDGNGNHVEPEMLCWLDAMTASRPSLNPDAGGIFFSPQRLVGGCVSGTPFRPGDVGRILPGGQFQFFLTADQIRSAFGIPATQTINVDAITYDDVVPVSTKSLFAGDFLLFLSLEDDHTGVFHDITGAVVANSARDGAILAIPFSAIGLPVVGVAPGTGILVATEAEVAAMTNNSGVRDREGVLLGLIADDLDALDLDPKGGTFQTATGTYPNMIYCTESMTGAGILTTDANGQVAQINGVPMANRVGPTTGARAGLRPGNVGSLNGLHYNKAQVWSRLVLDSPTQRIPCPPGGPMRIDLGGGDPGAPAVLLVSVGPNLPCSVMPMVLFPNPGLSALIPFLAMTPALVYGADGTTSFGTGLPCPSAPPFNLVFQAVTVKGAAIALSTPLTVQLN